MRRNWNCLIFPVLLALLSACGESQKTGAEAVVWDRDTCKSCLMVLSDRHYAVEIRGGPRRELSKFDDLGCALVWLEQQPWKDAADTEIWVTDARTGAWLDARQATYEPGRITPMDYGLGALTEGGSLDFAAARAVILSKQRALDAYGHQHTVP